MINQILSVGEQGDTIQLLRKDDSPLFLKKLDPNEKATWLSTLRTLCTTSSS